MFPRVVPVLCVSAAAVCGVVVLVVGREPDYISTAARKRDEPVHGVRALLCGRFHYGVAGGCRFLQQTECI